MLGSTGPGVRGRTTVAFASEDRHPSTSERSLGAVIPTPAADGDTPPRTVPRRTGAESDRPGTSTGGLGVR